MTTVDGNWSAKAKMSDLLNAWPGDIKGELIRRSKAAGLSRSQVVLHELLEEEHVPAEKPRPFFLHNLAAQPHSEYQGYRTRYMREYRRSRGALPKVGDWTVPADQQNITEEAVLLLDTFDRWAKGRPPAGRTWEEVREQLMFYAGGNGTQVTPPRRRVA